MLIKDNSLSLKLRLVFTISLIFNFIFIGCYGLKLYNNPSNKIGVLKREVKVYMGKEPQEQFIIPKGFVVRDASPRGFAAIGHFEPYHFQIIVTTEDRDLIDYNNLDKSRKKSEYYPAVTNNY